MKFSKINNISGWLVFGIALIVYLMTMEPTVSFWDCGEFISCAYKLQVGHSPGAPLFMLLGRFFAIFAPGPQSVALYVNALSAFASAFTILFLYWSITHFAKRLATDENGNYSSGSLITIVGSGIVGALAYTFSDTFWFSAVEGEVYATSSFFTALVFWCILKWEESNEVYADRWLVLIAYLIGLSIGVHLLSLLVIPTIALIYYFKRYAPNLRGGLVAYFLGGVVLLLVQYGVIQYIPIWASKFELTFVNSLGMPLNSGAIFFMVLFSAILAVGILFAKKKGKHNLHVAILSLVFMTIGYLCYVPTVIRANAGVSINMTNPDNVMSLIPYLQRTQYGSTPFLTGQYFDTQYETEEGDPIYLPVTKDGKTSYEVVGHDVQVNYNEKHLFPRIWSADNDRGHVRYYRNTLGLSEGESPNASDNFSFFFDYQLNHMFWRYFMWNYSGRQNDYQGFGTEAQNGNWITGFNALDKFMGRGDFEKMPDAYKKNRAHNTMFFLPFVLGLLGLVYQFKRKRLDGFVVLSLWFFTGIAVQLYINNTPYQPRERDYQYIAAYAYAIWIGIGVFMIREWVLKIFRNPVGAASLATIVALFAAPILLASQEWDDHDRSEKTLALDHARNMLATCDKNAILITNGDNETYPLWYIQEVEGFRTDVRIFNYNLLGTDWQNLQMFGKTNDAPAIDVLWNKDFVAGYGNQNYFYVNELPSVKGQTFAAKDVINFLMDPRNAVTLQGRGGSIPVLPVRSVAIPLDRNALLSSGLIDPKDTALQIPEALVMKFGGQAVLRSDMSMLNIIAAIAKDGWKRPLYICNGVSLSGLESYLKKEGVLMKLVPVATPAMAGMMPVANVEKDIELFTKTYTFGKANTDRVYYDEPNKRTFWDYRTEAAELAIRLAAMGRKEEAIKVMDRSFDQISESSFPTIVSGGREQTGILSFKAYLVAGAVAKAERVGGLLAKFSADYANYFLGLGESGQVGSINIMIDCAGTLQELINASNQNGQAELAKKYTTQFENMTKRLNAGSESFRGYMQQLQMQQQQQLQQQQKLALPQAEPVL